MFSTVNSWRYTKRYVVFWSRQCNNGRGEWFWPAWYAPHCAMFNSSIYVEKKSECEYGTERKKRLWCDEVGIKCWAKFDLNRFATVGIDKPNRMAMQPIARCSHVSMDHNILVAHQFSKYNICELDKWSEGSFILPIMTQLASSRTTPDLCLKSEL